MSSTFMSFNLFCCLFELHLSLKNLLKRVTLTALCEFFLCLFKLPLEANLLAQLRQLKGLSPLCERKWMS